MKNSILALALILPSTVLTSADDLVTYRTTYERNLHGVLVSHDKEIADLGRKYLKSLDILLARARESGDLEKTMALSKEIDRFNGEKTVSEQLSELSDIRPLQSSYRKQAAVLELNRAKRLISLVSRYDSVLGKLQKQLVVSGKLDEAVTVQEERKRVKATEPVSAARSLVSRTVPVKPEVESEAHRRTTLTVRRPEQSVFERSGASFRSLEAKTKYLKKGCSLYEDREYTMSERPKQLSSTKYVMASFDGCRAVCEKEGVAFALGLIDIHNQSQTDRVKSYLKDKQWARVEEVPPFALFYSNGANRMGELYWREVKKGEELAFPTGTILCYRTR